MLNVIGVPSSAASYSAGQEQAPAALRAAGLLEALRGAGHQVYDAGDLTFQAWRPDRDRPRAQNLGQVCESVAELAAAAQALLNEGDRLLVVGGNCTTALGVCAGLRHRGVAPALVYVDRHLDLNTPASTDEGALDWMGMAHALAVEGATEELMDAMGDRPLLSPRRLSYLGIQESATTAWEREQVQRLGLAVVSSQELAERPQQAAGAALGALPGSPFAVHLDVDVLDFIDAPIAENVNGRNSGPTMQALQVALGVLWGHPDCRALSVGEVNPVHAACEPGALERFLAAVAAAIAPAAAVS